jgi:hypothetical protein
MAGEAEVKYRRRLRAAAGCLRCAVTDTDTARRAEHWSVDLQEAHALPEAVLQRHFPTGSGRGPTAEDGRMFGKRVRHPSTVLRLSIVLNAACPQDERHWHAAPARVRLAVALSLQQDLGRHQDEAVAVGVVAQVARPCARSGGPESCASPRPQCRHRAGSRRTLRSPMPANASPAAAELR